MKLKIIQNPMKYIFYAIIKEKRFIDNNFSNLLDEYVKEYTDCKSFKEYAEEEMYPATIPIDRDEERSKLFKNKYMQFKVSNKNLLEDFINKKYDLSH